MVSWCPDASFDTHISVFQILAHRSILMAKLTKMTVKIEWLVKNKKCFYGCQKKHLDIKNLISFSVKFFYVSKLMLELHSYRIVTYTVLKTSERTVIKTIQLYQVFSLRFCSETCFKMSFRHECKNKNPAKK